MHLKERYTQARILVWDKTTSRQREVYEPKTNRDQEHPDDLSFAQVVSDVTDGTVNPDTWVTVSRSKRIKIHNAGMLVEGDERLYDAVIDVQDVAEIFFDSDPEHPVMVKYASLVKFSDLPGKTKIILP